MPVGSQAPVERVRNFNEVTFGYSPEDAAAEAGRCLQCKIPKCVEGCPVNIDIPGFVKELSDGDVAAAARIIEADNLLPGVCGRVCPQESQCEQSCILAPKGKAISIGKLERFASDRMAEKGPVLPPKAEPSGKAVAVIGSGPAGLTAAVELARYGHKVTIFEALHLAGGVLTYGIPEFRLPQAVVDREIELLEAMGIRIELNFVVGRTASLEELLEQYEAVFIGIGAGLPLFMGIPGENLNGVYSANEFLSRSNLMCACEFPKYDTPVKRGGTTVVVGGGNVAMDSARTALRMNADKVYIVYRRSRAEMPARVEEVDHGAEEGVEFLMLTNPVRINGSDGQVESVTCQRMELGEPDESGRRSPVPVEGEFFDVPCDRVIMAIGTGANPLLPSTVEEIELDRRGYISVDDYLETTVAGVYAGGDIVTGAATVIKAMGAGKQAAAAMNRYLAARPRS